MCHRGSDVRCVRINTPASQRYGACNTRYGVTRIVRIATRQLCKGLFVLCLPVSCASRGARAPDCDFNRPGLVAQLGQTEAVNEVPRSEPRVRAAAATALRLSARQQPADAEVIVSLTLTNISGRPVSVIDGPTHDPRGGIWLVLVDILDRRVPFLCRADGHKAVPARRSLAPGESLSTPYRFEPDCYHLNRAQGFSFTLGIATMMKSVRRHGSPGSRSDLPTV
jgi:hypothetical protein